jgi:hypothetical protein
MTDKVKNKIAGFFVRILPKRIVYLCFLRVVAKSAQDCNVKKRIAALTVVEVSAKWLDIKGCVVRKRK